MLARTPTSGPARTPARPVAALVLTVWLTIASAGPAVATAPEPIDTPPPSTFNVFYPEERPLSDCLSAVPKPGCGSEARGGWRQGTVFALLIGGFGFIAWRIVRATRSTSSRHSTVAPDGE